MKRELISLTSVEAKKFSPLSSREGRGEKKEGGVGKEKSFHLFQGEKGQRRGEDGPKYIFSSLPEEGEIAFLLDARCDVHSTGSYSGGKINVEGKLSSFPLDRGVFSFDQTREEEIPVRG